MKSNLGHTVNEKTESTTQLKATSLLVCLLASGCASLSSTNTDLPPWKGEQAVSDEPAVPGNQPPAMQDNSATGRRESVPTRFYGAELVREKVKVGDKEEFRMILRGDATIVHDKTILKSPVIILDPDNEGRLLGGVTVYDRDQGMVLHANEGTYSRKKELVRITGSPRFEFKQKDQKPIVSTTGEILRDLAENITRMEGGVRMHGEKWSLLADRGIYSDTTGIFHLEKEPVLIGKDLYMSGGDVDYDAKEKAVILKNRPFARMFVYEERPDRGKEKGTSPSHPAADPALLKRLVEEKKITPAQAEKYLKEQQKREGDNGADEKEKRPDSKEAPTPTATAAPKPTPYDFSATRIEYRFGEQPEAHLIGGVRITSEMRSITGTEFILSGKNLSVIETDTGIEMVDKKEAMDVKARQMRYDTKKRWIWLSGDPVVTMKEKHKPGVRAVLAAAVIERDMEKEIIHARGNVRMKRRNEEAVAEIGIFREKDETMDLFGRPYLYRNGTWMSCKRVRMYSNPDRVVFEEDVSGGMR